jgi:dCTP deaminase
VYCLSASGGNSTKKGERKDLVGKTSNTIFFTIILTIMAILTHDELIKKIDEGTIKIDPFDPKRVGPASIDFTLGTRFRIFKELKETIELKSDAFDPDEFSDLVTLNERLVIHPHETVLGITVEKLTLPGSICGWIQGRSRFARVGLMVHITSSFIQPGISNHQVLEIYNAGPIPIAIYPGIAVCQIVFEETAGNARYTGKYRNQTSP